MLLPIGVSAACHVVEQRAQCGHSASNSGCTAAADEHCSVRGHEPTRTALCLFGMTRNIDATRSYLEQNLIGPLSSACALDIFIHNLLHEDVRANFSIGVRACREEQEVQRDVDARLILQDRVARTMQRSIGRLHYTHSAGDDEPVSVALQPGLLRPAHQSARSNPRLLVYSRGRCTARYRFLGPTRVGSATG